ncbi:hypothetical protein CW752_05630 [Chryseobacterium sp. PMSZPI]|nr:hypothetical protein CW752_05630 [Chryseobacterium sp. PMSZPI]
MLKYQHILCLYVMKNIFVVSFFEVLKLIFFRRLKKAGLMNVMKAPDHRKCPKKGSVFMNLF